MNQEIRNKLRNVVTQCRKLLEDSVSQELEGKYGIFVKKDQVTADPIAEQYQKSEVVMELIATRRTAISGVQLARRNSTAYSRKNIGDSGVSPKAKIGQSAVTP